MANGDEVTDGVSKDGRRHGSMIIYKTLMGLAGRHRNVGDHRGYFVIVKNKLRRAVESADEHVWKLSACEPPAKREALSVASC